MKPRTISIGFYLLFSIVCCSHSSAQQPADSLIKRVKAKLSTVIDYEGQGSMKTDVSFLKVPESKVTIWYKKPDKLKIKKENGISIIPKGGVNINLAALFAGDNYTAVAAGKSTVNNIPVTIVKLLPLDEKSEMVVSTLYIDEKNALVEKASVTTRDNGTYDLEMTYGKYAGWGLPDKIVFIFTTKDYKLPKGLAFDYDTGEKPDPKKASNNDQKGKLEIDYSSYTINKGLSDNMFK